MDGKVIESALMHERLRIALIIVRHHASLANLERSKVDGFAAAWNALTTELIDALECKTSLKILGD